MDVLPNPMQIRMMPRRRRRKTNTTYVAEQHHQHQHLHQQQINIIRQAIIYDNKQLTYLHTNVLLPVSPTKDLHTNVEPFVNTQLRVVCWGLNAQA